MSNGCRKNKAGSKNKMKHDFLESSLSIPKLSPLQILVLFTECETTLQPNSTLTLKELGREEERDYYKTNVHICEKAHLRKLEVEPIGNKMRTSIKMI